MSHLPKTTDNIGKITGRMNNQDRDGIPQDEC